MTAIWNLRAMFQPLLDRIAPKPEAELGFMRHEPMGSDEEVEWWEDLMYLKDLADDVVLQVVYTGWQLNLGPLVENTIMASMSQEERLCLVGPMPFEWLWAVA
jgi:hypothetical protein